MGGVIAFEMAKQMEAMGRKVQLLAMFDAFVPEKINATETRKCTEKNQILLSNNRLIKK